jgi:hypothetical protein
MHSRPVYLLHISFAVLLFSAAAPAHAIPVMINNGLAPPNPENVIDGADDYSGKELHVRNVGCPTGWPAVVPDGSCASPGAATEVEVVSGGVATYLFAYDTSTITMSDGRADYLRARHTSTTTMSGGEVRGYLDTYESSTVTMSGGTVERGLRAYASSTITMSGGTVEGDLFAHNSSIITINGFDFMVDGTPVPFGDLSALTGTLTGTLTNGGSLDNDFYQGGYAGTWTGTIRLVPEPTTASLLALGLLGIAAVGRKRAH